MLKIVASDPLTRYRGDTLGDKVTITSNGTTPMDVSAYSARMSVNVLKDPTDTDTPLYTLTGTFDTDGTDGVFLFEPSAIQADQAPGKYYYDVELTTPSGKIVTVAKGSYTYKQDVSK